MAVFHGRDLKKKSGGRKRRHRAKRRFELGSAPAFTIVGKVRKEKKRKRGMTEKIRLTRAEFANVCDPKTKKCALSRIITVKENLADPNYARMNIITRGAVIETEAGIAKVTSKPGQSGVVNAVLVEYKEKVKAVSKKRRRRRVRKPTKKKPEKKAAKKE